MSLPARIAQSVLRITATDNHTVRRYEGDPHDLIEKMIAERRTGVTMIFHNQGHIYQMAFDSRAKFLVDVSEITSV